MSSDPSGYSYSVSNFSGKQVYALIQSFWAYFPSLKFVIVDRFNGFDSTAASLPGSVVRGDGKSIANPSPLPKPVILSAAGCSQLDIGVITSRPYSNYLIYLDVSGTSKKTIQNIFNHRQVPHLRILKMRNLRLTTAELVPLLRELTCRLFSLDVRNNFLTDDVVRWLLALCFLEALEQRPNLRPEVDGNDRLSCHTASSSRCNSPERYADDVPRYRDARDGIEEQETAVSDGKVDLRPDEVDDVVQCLQRYEKMKSLRSHNTLLEEDPMVHTTGLTHLRLADNKLTSDALQTLLMSTNRLQLLDFGGAPQGRHRLGAKNPNLRPICQPDTVKLLCPGVSQRLQSLRVHHSIITHTPTLLTIGEYVVSEGIRMRLSERDYAEEEMIYWPRHWNPNSNPRIETLILTDVPRWSEGLVIKRFIQVLRVAAIQESLISKATLESTRRSWRMLPGLRLLRLELVPLTRKQEAASPSVSGNSDADVFARESANDFSFFDQVSEKSNAEKDFSFFEGETTQEPLPVSPTRNEQPSPIGRDVMKEILAYRQKTRMAYEAERERLKGSGMRVPLGAPHYHWTGRLEFV
jgi:hypothetical protein